MYTVFVVTRTLTRVPLHSAQECFNAAFRTGFPVSIDSEYVRMVQAAAGDDFQEHICPQVSSSGSASFL